MSDFDGYGAPIGRAADLMPEDLLPKVPPIKVEPVHPIVSLEELERPSPQSGHPDPEFPEFDTRDPLYVPRFLVRRWGSERFLRSPYYKLWESEAGRGKRIADPKPGSEVSASWDVALTRVNKGKMEETMIVTLPRPLGRSLIEEGFSRAMIEVTAEGIVLRPYIGNGRSRQKVELPEEWK